MENKKLIPAKELAPISIESFDEFACAVKKLANRIKGCHKAVRKRQALQLALEEME